MENHTTHNAHAQAHKDHKIKRVTLKTPPAHSFGYRAPVAAKTIAVILSAILVFIGTAAAAFWVEINSTLEGTKTTVIAQKNVKRETVDPNAGKALDILVMGIDSRDGADNQSIGGSGAGLEGNHQADTTMVVHISADRKFIDIVSIPRDSMVSAPSCETSNGTIPARYNVMFNSIFSTAYDTGGDLASAASCTMSAVNDLTGLSISQFITVDFSGLSKIISALGGVEVCIAEDFTDLDTNLSLKAGLNKLDGVQATQYARVRHGLGDGSDVMRTVRQQYLIKMLMREALNKDFFSDSPSLYNMARVALQSLKMSDSLADLGVLVGLASSLKNFTTSAIHSQTVPVATAPSNPNRVVWTDSASALWDAIANDRSLSQQSEDETATSSESSSSSQDTSSTTTDDSSNASSNSSSAQSGQTDTSSSSDAATQAQSQTPQVDPHTGLIEQADGTLLDPETGGYVDKSDATIRDPQTGWSIGLAERYLNYTFCHIES